MSSPCLGLASMATVIPIATLRTGPIALAPYVRVICAQTQTHICMSASDMSRTCHKDKWPTSSSVTFCISGKLRDCYAAARLLWYRLTKPFVAIIHKSWLPLLQQLEDESELLRAYSVTVCCIPGHNMISLRGRYWEVLKLRRELIVMHENSCSRYQNWSTEHRDPQQTCQLLASILSLLNHDLLFPSPKMTIDKSFQLLTGLTCSRHDSYTKSGHPFRESSNSQVVEITETTAEKACQTDWETSE